MDPNKVFAIVVLAITCGTAVILGTVRMLVSRGRSRPLPDRTLAQIDARLTRMEQAIDAMAIEMERVSEGQRFTTRLLAERAAQPTE